MIRTCCSNANLVAGGIGIEIAAGQSPGAGSGGDIGPSWGSAGAGGLQHIATGSGTAIGHEGARELHVARHIQLLSWSCGADANITRSVNSTKTSTS